MVILPKRNKGIYGNDQNTILLLHCDGIDASTTFIDVSRSRHIITANGVAQVDTAQQKFGTGSLRQEYDIASYLLIPDHACFQFSSFTIDLWVRFETQYTSTESVFFLQRVDYNNYQKFGLYCSDVPTKTLRYQVLSGASELVSVVSNSLTVANDTWYHFALVKSGNDYYMFQDGVSVLGSTSDSSSIPNYAASALVGTDVSGPLSAWHCIEGWIDEYRISNKARWTSGFSVATKAYS